jgi:hypothetical protein
MNVVNLRKDMKFYIRVVKNGITQGSAEFIITQLSFVKREELVSKTLNVISLLKKEVMGKLLMKSRITYTDTKGGDGTGVPRSSSAIPLSAQQVNRGSMQTMNNGQYNSSKRTTLGTYITQFNSSNPSNYQSQTASNKKNSQVGTKKSMNFGSPNSKRFSAGEANRKASMQVHAENVQVKEDLDTSRIEDLFDDDKQADIANVGKELGFLIYEIKERYKGKFKEDENPEDRTEKGFRAIVDSLFELQAIYYGSFDKSVSLNSCLKSYLVDYSENYRMFNKKTNRLNELLDSFTVKTQFSDVLNRQENKRINDSIEIIKKEVKIYKNILNLKYDQELLEKYKEEMRSEKCKFFLIYFFLFFLVYIFLFFLNLFS